MLWQTKKGLDKKPDRASDTKEEPDEMQNPISFHPQVWFSKSCFDCIAAIVAICKGIAELSAKYNRSAGG